MSLSTGGKTTKILSALNKKGIIYIFRNAGQKPGDEQWSVVFVGDTKQEINPDIEVIGISYYVDNTKSQQNNIDDVLNYFAMSYRKRAQVAGDNYE